MKKKKQIEEEKLREYRVGYKKYLIAFRKEKKINNIQNGVRQLTYNQYKRTRNEDKLNNKEILAKQTKLATEAKKRKLLKEYRKYALKPGERAVFDNTYWGDTWAETNAENEFGTEGFGYHRTLSGILGDGHVLHFLIAGRILQGEDRDTVLDDYGYDE